MQPFTRLVATATPLRQENVDTDQVIPARFLTGTVKTGLGSHLFNDWRYRGDGSPDPCFVLNDPRFEGARILIAGRNFGCGSSREHAPWALTDYGFRAIIAPSFADIFCNNALKNSLLPVALPSQTVSDLMGRVEADPRLEIVIDLASQTVTVDDGAALSFEIDPFRKQCLLEGLDDIGYALKRQASIAAYEQTASPSALSYA
ncbi:MAG: 3-isopropylmalate dehydratase small subunit [Vampirovibrionales bacterium]|nr:3-isopropylmalate dehydratase small subunit [Vampirovibrionales bacterium]